ncbi:DUF3100 domain-containing protein [Sediminispirochaeta bajacaliforniensis]|uniref:DUF3100 domain-containing protein n=1 Tax=Sediminispirochaeta bajacaliforniensis TaxID=148 RepID=UPI00036080C0|nr:DUF3100 domain-containing protein [Sediminispirochaeta bajacaliforniensis]
MKGGKGTDSGALGGFFAVVKDSRLMLSVVGIVVVSELIGIVKIPLGASLSIALFPMLYAMILGMFSYFLKAVKKEQSEKAENMILLAILPLIAKLGMSIGPSLSKLSDMGLAILLQEFGHVGSILIALPIGLLFGFRRELVGMTHSIGREANVSLIAERYGIDSDEGRGVMTIYIVGTLLGTLFYGLMVPVFVKMIPSLHVEAWALASGVGSGSMMAASSGALSTVFPDRAKDILAYAGASQVLTTATGLYMSIFIFLPLTNRLYAWLSPIIGKKKDEEKTI